MSEHHPVIVCLTTTKDQEEARSIAGQLIEESLAACVQIDTPIESHYRWEGKVCRETEYRLVIKTSVEKTAALRERLRTIHSYDQPQIVMLASHDADPGYARWVHEETAGR